MKINSLNLSKLRNEEHFQFHTEHKKLIINHTPEALNIEEAYSVYLPLIDNEDKALNLIRKSPLTDELADADNLRDATYKGLRKVIKAGTRHYDAATKKAAGRIQLVINQYGKLSIKPYNEETAAINKLISELNTNHADDVTAAGINGWLNELQSNNDTFEELIKDRYTEEAGKTQLRMKEVRLETDAAYRNITKRINALIFINGEEAYSGFVNELNERIEKYGLILAQRQGRNDKSEDDQNDDDQSANDQSEA